MNQMKRTYFEVWGNEEAQNSILKGLLVVIGVLFVCQSIALTILVFRKPLLVAVGESETAVFNVSPPTETLLTSELKRVLLKYAEAHYNWDSSNIEKAHAEAAKYVSPKLVKAFNAANAERSGPHVRKRLPSACTLRLTFSSIRRPYPLAFEWTGYFQLKGSPRLGRLRLIFLLNTDPVQHSTPKESI